MGMLRGVLGLLASVARAVPQRLQPRLQVLQEGGVGALVDALQLVGIGREVIEFPVPVIVFDVLMGLGPNGLKAGRAARPLLAFALAFAFAAFFTAIFLAKL